MDVKVGEKAKVGKRKNSSGEHPEGKKIKPEHEYERFEMEENKVILLNKSLSNEYYHHYEYSIRTLEDLLLLGTFYTSTHYDKEKHTNIPFYNIHRLRKPIERLLHMVGLEDLKKQLLSLCIFYLQRFDDGNQDMLHTVVYGGPGVGKTKFIGILSEIYANLGVLPSRKVTFLKRADLVGQYLGHTAVKTKQAIENAKGGILVIDEAYSLGDTEQRDSFSRECIDTLNQYLSEEKKDLVCVIAGYKEDLEKRFFKTNPGLERRFPFKFTIPDYSAKQLKDIFHCIVKENGWNIEPNAIREDLLKEHRDCFPFNGGDMEVLFTKTKFIHSMRVFTEEKNKKKKITRDDFEKAVEEFTETDSQRQRRETRDFISSLYI
jgi:SpoVK/Ycf46/Vps4 family AAA+-type ATPase